MEPAAARPPRRSFTAALFALVRRLLWVFLSALLLILALFFGGAIALGMILGWAGPSDLESRVLERHFSHNPKATDKIAIISVEGAILEGRGFVQRQIDRARKDHNVRAVVLRVDSPGGTVTGSDYIYHRLTELARDRKIPIVVSMGALAASGGYYVAMAVGPRPDTIYAEPTTWTGSIGVMIPHYDASELLKHIGLRQDSLVSGPLKGMGTITRPMTEKEREVLQGLVKEGFERFKQIVRQGRSKFDKDPKALDELATGQVYSAEQAVRNGLVDKIGFLEDAVDRAVALAGLPADQVNVVEYRREFSWIGYLLESRAHSPVIDVGALLDLTVPRAYYLYSCAPSLVTSGE
jgi:protease-4